MSRARKGFVVVQVLATIRYEDRDGHQHKIQKAATAGSQHNLSDARKRELKTKQAKKIISDTIADLKRQGMMRCRGSVETRYYARVGYKDEDGQRHDLVRGAKSIAAAQKQIKKLLDKLEKQDGLKTIQAENMTFEKLAAYFEKNYLKPAKYVNGEKVSGVRSIVPALAAVNALKSYFGKRRLQSITPGSLEAYRDWRLEQPTPADLWRHKRELKSNPKAQRQVTRTGATVNRELSKLRRMLAIAVAERWIEENPFTRAKSIMAAERQRERIITIEEEQRLLAACVGPREHLRPIIIMAIHTGMRRGEMFKLKWKDVDFEAQQITIQGTNTKTLKERKVPLTARLNEELSNLWEQSTKDHNRLVFGLVDNCKRSWNFVRKVAELEDVRMHDLRHTHATRLDDLGFSLARIGAQLGHTQVQTTLRYVNRHDAGMRQIANAFDGLYQQTSITTAESDVVN